MSFKSLFQSPYQAEPPYTHGQPAKTAVLLCNLGTPDAPEPQAVRRYLAQFLSDSRVVEIPKLLWLLILHGIILRFRPAQSAKKYASIWTSEGSPLKVETEKQTHALQQQLQTMGHNVLVRYAMRYGAPAIATQLDALKSEGATRILILPAYPQYSATTTASVFDAVYLWAARQRRIPELRFVNHYHDHPAYIQALAHRIQNQGFDPAGPTPLIMSFHGVPERTLHLGDPYHCECYKTARLVSEALGLPAEKTKVTFQSRFGKAKWLEPYTEPSLIDMAKTGTRDVTVVCPGFISDCLETLEEINQEARHAFLSAGGASFNYIPCLNNDPVWINSLAQITLEQLAGWPTAAQSAQHLHNSRMLALKLGARQ